jgi:hypothetical protein
MDKIFVVVESEGWGHTSAILAYDTYEVAEMVRNAYEKSEEGQWYSYYIKEYEVHKSPGTLPKPWSYYDEEQEQ